MSKPFESKVAVVTGAGVGIGFEICRQLVMQGAKVVLNDADATLAANAANEIGDMSQIIVVGGDVADVALTQSLVTTAVETFGRLDIAVANAGLTTWCDFFDYTPEMFDRITAVNLKGSYFLAQAAARQFRAQGQGGRILFMSSVTGHQAIPYVSAYGMTKAALEHLAKNLVVEVAKYGITVNCIAPGATVTPRNLNDDPDYEAHWASVIPTGQAAFPSDIANAALFLLSNAAAQITGQTIVVDGGWTAISPTPSLDFVAKK